MFSLSLILLLGNEQTTFSCGKAKLGAIEASDCLQSFGQSVVLWSILASHFCSVMNIRGAGLLYFLSPLRSEFSGNF